MARGVGGVGGSGVPALVAVGVKEVADAEANAQTAVEEGGQGAEVDGEGVLLFVVEAEGGSAVVGADLEVHQLGHFGPQTGVEVPGEAFLKFLAFHLVALVVDAAAQAEVEPCGGAVGAAGVEAVLERAGDVVGHGVADDTAQPGVDSRGGSGDALDAARGVVGIGVEADVAEGLVVAVPAEGEPLGVGGTERAVADAVAVVVVLAAEGEVGAGGVGDGVREVEAEVVHALGAVGEAQRGFEVKEAEGGVVGEEAVRQDVEPVHGAAEFEAESGVLPLVAPTDDAEDRAAVVVGGGVAEGVGKGVAEGDGVAVEERALAVGVAVGGAADAEGQLVDIGEGAVVGEHEGEAVATRTGVAGAVVAVEEQGRGQAEGKVDDALPEHVVGGEHVVPRSAESQVVTLPRKAALDVEVGEAVEGGEARVGAVAVAVVRGVGQVVPLLAAAQRAVVVVALEHGPVHEGEVGCGVDFVAEVEHEVAEVAGAVGLGLVSVAAGGVACGREHGGVAMHEIVAVAVAAGEVDVEPQAVGIADIAGPGREVGACVATQAHNPQLGGAQANGGDDVDDVRAALHHVFSRGVLDDLDAGHGVGWQALEEGPQHLAADAQALAVEPHLHFVGTAHGEVALGVDLHGGGVTDGVPGGEAFHGLVVLDVVVHHLAGHAVDGLGGGDADGGELQELHLGIDTVQGGLADGVGGLGLQIEN